MFYTVRIWNNDSCSVVRPVKINVREKPKFQSVLINPTICGSTTGRISVSASSATSYSLNNGTWQSGALFLNLAEGNYTVSILDAFGCQNDTVVTLGYQNATQAIFNVNPNAGAAPLSVQLSNQSVNANLFQWSINGLPFAGDLTNYTFDTSGVYVIQLIASNNFAYCADTAFLTVFVYDSLVVTIPNVFSPNGDGINDFYSLSANQDVSYDFQILNRWGTEIFRGNGTLQAGNSKQIWDGSTIVDGVYFIHLKIVDSENQQYQFQEFITVKN
jgi:gliding motility-associated-like protein